MVVADVWSLLSRARLDDEERSSEEDEEDPREQTRPLPHDELDGWSGGGGGGGEADAGSIGGLPVSGRSSIGRGRQLGRGGVGLSCGVGR